MTEPGFHSKASDKEQQELKRTQGTALSRFFSRGPLVLLLTTAALIYIALVVAQKS